MASFLSFNTNPSLQRTQSRSILSLKPISCFGSKPPNSSQFLEIPSNSSEPINLQTRFINAIVLAPKNFPLFKDKKSLIEINDGGDDDLDGGKTLKTVQFQVGRTQMLCLCGFGYWIQGFRCFPWLALNFHMAHNLHFNPSVLQLVQNCANLPFVAKPLYGVLSDALYIGGAHRIPYVSIGVLLQIISWGLLALIPFIGESLPTIMACVLISNLGASLTEVAQDALVTEYGQKNKIIGLQSYTFMAIALAGILGNSLGGIILSTTHSRTVFSIFAFILLLHLSVSLITKEESLGMSKPECHNTTKQSFMNNIRKQFSGLFVALQEEEIVRPLIWIVASISVVPILSGSMFCYQTQHLNLDASVIGVSRVIGQGLLLALTLLYDRFWRTVGIRKLASVVQIFYAFSLLLDLVLVMKINLNVGIPNNIFVLCFSGLAETIATFKTVPFFVLIASLCPRGCEASLTSFLASALCLSSILSGFLGIGLASLLGITSGNYTSLSVGILVQFVAALVPLIWIGSLDVVQEERRTKGLSKGSQRFRMIREVLIETLFSCSREWGFEK